MQLLTNLNLSKNELQFAVVHPLTTSPASPKEGQIYYNSIDHFIYVYDGSTWIPVGVTYSQGSTTGVVITGLSSSGTVTTNNVIALTLTGYTPVSEGVVTTNMTLEQAIYALDNKLKDIITSGGEPNQNAWSYVVSAAQSSNTTTEVSGNSSSVTISASAKTDTINLNTGDAWIRLNTNGTNKTATIGHKFSGVTAGTYGATSTASVEAKLPVINVDNAGHITSASASDIVGTKYIRSLTSDAQTQLNSKANSADVPTATTTSPKMDGTATIGTETTWAKGDHIHPTDTSRQAVVTGAATTITDTDLTANRALISNNSGKVAVSDVTSTELGYLDGVTSGVQSQLNALDTRIDDISAIGRFLSYWNCSTGLPVTNPTTSPYTYNTGDYYVVSVVGSSTNYKPNGSTYTTGVASTTVETLTVEAQDVYRYDGTNWTLSKNTLPDLSGYVATFSQSFTDSQKLQARTNIGAGTSSFSGSYDDLTNKPTIPTISLNGSTTTSPAFYAPTTVGTNGQVLTSNGSGAPTWQNASSAIHKYTATNSAIVSSGGQWTWTIPASTHGIANNAMFVALYDVSSGSQVLSDIIVNQTNYLITINILDTESVGTLSADTYRVVAIG